MRSPMKEVSYLNLHHDHRLTGCYMFATVARRSGGVEAIGPQCRNRYETSTIPSPSHSAADCGVGMVCVRETTGLTYLGMRTS